MLIAVQINHSKNTITFIRDEFEKGITWSKYPAPFDLLEEITDTLLNHMEIPFERYPYGYLTVTNFLMMNSCHYILPEGICNTLVWTVF